MSATLATGAISERRPRGGEIPELRAGPVCERAAFSAIRRSAMLNGCKWDPQVGDVETLANFPLVMPRRTWRQLATWAEQLSREAVAAEQEVLHSPDLLRELGLPRTLRRVLEGAAPTTPSAGRIVRFDFHPTAEGWRISEANSDVPGGYSEASHFTSLMAEQNPGLHSAGNIGEVWADALSHVAGPGGVVVLMSAPGYMEDHQVVAFLAARLRERGCRTHLATPEQIGWREGVAQVDSPWYRGGADVIVRFYQCEWIARMPARFGWQHFIRGGRTPVANPGSAAITESKRFPLVWNKLATQLPAWRALLPETVEPRQADLTGEKGWLLKTAFCNTGDAVCMPELLPNRQWWQSRWAARLNPKGWVAQRRFDSMPLATPLGRRHVCVGVYTVNGRAAGAYTRLATRPLVDFAAMDVALLIEDDE